MGSAIGGSAPQSSNGVFRLDARDFGIKPGLGYDNAPALQAAVDALGAKVNAANVANPGSSFMGILKIPAASRPYALSQPIWIDHGLITIEGEDSGTTIEMNPQCGFPAFILCMPRTPTVSGQLYAIDATYRPDLFGKLDATAAPATGRRWGFRTNLDGFLVSQASHFTHGPIVPALAGHDAWRTTKKLTVEFAVEMFGSGNNVAQLMGMGHANVQACYPFIVYTLGAPNHYRVAFCTQPYPFGPSSTRQFDFVVPGSGVQHVGFQIDLTTATVTVYGNGTQLAVNLDLKAGWQPGLSFVENDYFPFEVGDLNAPAPAYGGLHPWDFALYGLAMSASIKYANNAAGQPQARSDGQAVTDANRYFSYGSDPALIGHLAFTEPPSSNRHLTIQGNPDRSSMIMCQGPMLNNGGVGPVYLRNLHIEAGNYGVAIAIGLALGVRIENVRVDGGAICIGNYYCGANYKVSIEDCSLSGVDSGIMMMMSQTLIRNVDFGNCGRSTMRFAGCDIDAAHMDVSAWTPNNETTLAIHSVGYGGIYTFRDLSVDYEGPGYGRSFCYAERHPYNGQTSLKLEDVNLGTIGNVPLIILNDAISSQYSPGRLMVDNLQTFGPPATVVALNGPNWYGEVKDSAFGAPAVRVTNDGTWGTQTNVTVVEDTFIAPPRTGSFYAGAHRWVVKSSADGQFAEWRCVTTGGYGTASPPGWAGVNQLAVRPGSLAGYVLNHAYITAVLS